MHYVSDLCIKTHLMKEQKIYAGWLSNVRLQKYNSDYSLYIGYSKLGVSPFGTVWCVCWNDSFLKCCLASTDPRSWHWEALASRLTFPYLWCLRLCPSLLFQIGLDSSESSHISPWKHLGAFRCSQPEFRILASACQVLLTLYLPIAPHNLQIQKISWAVWFLYLFFASTTCPSKVL